MTTRKDREEVEVLRGSLHGVARVLQVAADEGHAPGLANKWVFERPRRSRMRHQSELGFEQQNRFRNSQEIQRIEKKAFRARADAAQSARQGGTEPGTTRFRDGRATTGPPAPRRGPGAPTVLAAKRARPRKRANLARSKICTFGPELGFEQRNRFRSLRDTRRTEKKVLRKPPAARPVVGQTFKYIY